MKITWNLIILLTSLLLYTEQNFNLHLYNINKNMNRNDKNSDKITDIERSICGEYDSIIYTCCFNHNHHYVLCKQDSEECTLKKRNNEPKCVKKREEIK